MIKKRSRVGRPSDDGRSLRGRRRQTSRPTDRTVAPVSVPRYRRRLTVSPRTETHARVLCRREGNVDAGGRGEGVGPPRAFGEEAPALFVGGPNALDGDRRLPIARSGERPRQRVHLTRQELQRRAFARFGARPEARIGAVARRGLARPHTLLCHACLREIRRDRQGSRPSPRLERELLRDVHGHTFGGRRNRVLEHEHVRSVGSQGGDRVEARTGP